MQHLKHLREVGSGARFGREHGCVAVNLGSIVHVIHTLIPLHDATITLLRISRHNNKQFLSALLPCTPSALCSHSDPRDTAHHHHHAHGVTRTLSASMRSRLLRRMM